MMVGVRWLEDKIRITGLRFIDKMFEVFEILLIDNHEAGAVDAVKRTSSL